MAAKTTAAKTAADHEAIAADYSKQAAEAKRRRMHESRGFLFMRVPASPAFSRIGNRRGTESNKVASLSSAGALASRLHSEVKRDNHHLPKWELTEDHRMTKLATVALAALLAFSAAPVFPAFAAEDLSAKITAAKTAADHEALAAEFDKEAQEAEANAAAHEKMAASYKGLGKTGQVHETHCAAIAKRDREQAKDLKGLADAERAAAKAAK